MTRSVEDIFWKIDAFKQLFLKWNQRINLSAARTPSELDAHVADGHQLVPHLAGAARVLDVGAGGGLPVVVAAISLPDVSFTALEPVHKKHAFLRTVTRELDLTNLDPLARRVEDHAVRDYDVATSRATFDLVEWISLGATLVRPGGLVIGFEALPRDDLVLPFERHPYEVEGKSRALILVRRDP